MSKNKEFVITDDMYSEEKEFHFESMYHLCVSELQSQQSKRDQIIAFYIAIISFVVPVIINMNLNAQIKGAAFLLLYALGSMLSMIVVRYRVYKEVYWISCRTISQLYILDQNIITKDIIQSVFRKTMIKSALTILDMNVAKKKINLWKSYQKISKSAETILYEIMVLMSTVILGISAFLLMDANWFGLVATVVISAVIAVLSNLFWRIYFCKQLTSVYAAMTEDDEDKYFNQAYSKAWFLHFF